jgi:hypothetical protein
MGIVGGAQRAALVGASVVASVTILPYCDLLFDCGCVWAWFGAADHCDIVVSGPPDCPLCVGGEARWLGLAVAIVAAEYAALAAVARHAAGRGRPPTLMPSLAAAVAAYAGATALIALAYRLAA